MGSCHGIKLKMMPLPAVIYQLPIKLQKKQTKWEKIEKKLHNKMILNKFNRDTVLRYEKMPLNHILFAHENNLHWHICQGNILMTHSDHPPHNTTFTCKLSVVFLAENNKLSICKYFAKKGWIKFQ